MTAPDVRTAAQREITALRRVWLAVGNAPNPDDFKPSVRDRMWDGVVELAEEFATGSRRLYRENQQLEAALAAALVTPTREQIAQVLADLEPAYGGVDFYEGADAVLALMRERVNL